MNGKKVWKADIASARSYILHAVGDIKNGKICERTTNWLNDAADILNMRIKRR